MQTFACQNLLMLTSKRYFTSHPVVIDQKLICDIEMILVQNG